MGRRWRPFAGKADDASALFINPAGLGQLNRGAYKVNSHLMIGLNLGYLRRGYNIGGDALSGEKRRGILRRL